MRAICNGIMMMAIATVRVAPANAQVALGTCPDPQRTPACTDLQQQVTAMIADPAVSRAHWGVVVAAIDGTPIYSLNDAQFFQPASNTKLFTTAAAIALLGPDTTFETRVLTGDQTDTAGALPKNDIVLAGAGDANLSGRIVPYISRSLRPKSPESEPPPDPLRYLADFADKIVASGTKAITGDIIGDDTAWPWEPYPEAWGIDDMVWGYGAPVSALTVADNQLRLTITPGAPGHPALVVLDQAVPYYTVSAAVTTTSPKSKLGSVQVDRAPGSHHLRVYGRIAADTAADVEEIAIDDPAEYAALALKSLLEARGITVQGKARALHRTSSDDEPFLHQTRDPLPSTRGSTPSLNKLLRCVNDCDLRQHLGMTVIASHRSPPLSEDIVLTNKVSQNLHAELLLRHLGETLGAAGTAAQGARVVRSFLTNTVGIDPEDFVFYDGSGLSGRDLVTPRAAVRLLTWATTQPWFAPWKASLPIGGEDGSLATRFARPPLKGHLFAKTGTLGEARALSGYLDCASGRTVAFSVMVTDHAPGSHADQQVMDRIVAAIAATN